MNQSEVPRGPDGTPASYGSPAFADRKRDSPDCLILTYIGMFLRLRVEDTVFLLVLQLAFGTRKTERRGGKPR